MIVPTAKPNFLPIMDFPKEARGITSPPKHGKHCVLTIGPKFMKIRNGRVDKEKFIEYFQSNYPLDMNLVVLWPLNTKVKRL